jgi:hypothetical protein
MLGLGLGSEMGGRLANRLSPRAALKAFAVIEALLCMVGGASPFLFYDGLYLNLSTWMSDLGRVAVVQFLALLPPTLLMGASLPLLVRATVTASQDVPRLVTRLFAVNVLGSAIGAIATPWLLLRLGSMSTAALGAAALNGLVSLGAVILYRFGATAKPSLATESVNSPSEPVSLPGPPPPLSFWAFLFAISGLVALGLEMLWFRIIDVTLKGTAFTFGTVLGLYLLGLALGTFLPARPKRDPMLTFATCQAFVVAWAIGAIFLVAQAPETWPGMNSLIWRMASYRGRLGPAADAPTFMAFFRSRWWDSAPATRSGPPCRAPRSSAPWFTKSLGSGSGPAATGRAPRVPRTQRTVWTTPA